MFSKVKQAVIAAFMARAAGALGIVPSVYDNPTEDILHELESGRSVRMFDAGRKGPPVRLEENYLYSTRRFAEGAIDAGTYMFFNYAVGSEASSANFIPAVHGNLTELETNLDTPSQVPQGKNYVLRQIGVSFNAEAVSGDIEQMLDAAWLRFSKQGDQFMLRHGPVRLWPGGTGVSGFSTNIDTESAHNGIADPRAARALKVPRVLRAKESFSYAFVVPRSVKQITTAGESIDWELSQDIIATIWLWGGVADDIPA